MRSLSFAFAASACLGACAQDVRPAMTAEAGPCADATAWQDELRGLPDRVLRVEAKYLWDTCVGVAQVTGTSIVIRRSEGGSSERLKQLLECRHASFLVSGVPDGLLPPGLVEVDVKANADEAVVTIHADTVTKNIRLLQRARALTRHHG